MKKLLVSLGMFLLLFNSSSALSGLALGQSDVLVTPNPTTQPNSNAYGKSIEDWVESYIRWLFEGAALPGRNVTFLPIISEPDDPPFEIQVKPGTKMVLPIAVYLGFAEDSLLGVDNYYGIVTLDGQSIAEPNEDYFFEALNIDPPIADVVTFIEGIAVIVKPLKPGMHTIVLYSTINAPEGVYEFNNTWHITVAP